MGKELTAKVTETDVKALRTLLSTPDPKELEGALHHLRLWMEREFPETTGPLRTMIVSKTGDKKCLVPHRSLGTALRFWKRHRASLRRWYARDGIWLEDGNGKVIRDSRRGDLDHP